MNLIHHRLVVPNVPEGWHAMTGSIARHNGDLFVLQRTVNYSATVYNGYSTPDGQPILTRNFLMRLSEPSLEVVSCTEVLPPADLPDPPLCGRIRGFEDGRLFSWRGDLWCSATVVELNRAGYCEIVLARIASTGDGFQLSDWRILPSAVPKGHEKNWMPAATDETLRFVYKCSPTRIIDHVGDTVVETTPVVDADLFRGGSQAIPFGAGRLAVVHESWQGGPVRPLYLHRFVYFDGDWVLRSATPRFLLQKFGVEYIAGLALDATCKRLIMSYHRNDKESWIAGVDADEVAEALH